MFGPFDKMFDFNRDGELDIVERDAQFQYIDEMIREDSFSDDDDEDEETENDFGFDDFDDFD